MKSTWRLSNGKPRSNTGARQVVGRVLCPTHSRSQNGFDSGFDRQFNFSLCDCRATRLSRTRDSAASGREAEAEQFTTIPGTPRHHFLPLVGTGASPTPRPHTRSPTRTRTRPTTFHPTSPPHSRSGGTTRTCGSPPGLRRLRPRGTRPRPRSTSTTTRTHAGATTPRPRPCRTSTCIQHTARGT